MAACHLGTETDTEAQIVNYPTPDPGKLNCRGCLRLNLPGCKECRRCEDCGCRCVACHNCQTTHNAKYLCKTCRMCKRPQGKYGAAYACSCKTRPKAQKLLPLPRYLTRKQDPVTLKRPIGMELELAFPGNDTRAIQYASPVGVQWVHDGSVTVGGQELVVQPMIGDQLIQEVNYLGEAFKAQACTIDHTCGYHIHVGAEDYGVYELRRLLILYHRFEDLFYEIVEFGRDKPKRNARGELKCYCARLTWNASWYENLMRISRPAEIRRYLIDALYPDWVAPRYPRIDMRGVRRHKYEKCRYFGLNLHTWFERGTVEYRHHEGTMDAARILGWALFCGWFTEFASALTDKQVAGCYTVEHLLNTEWQTGRGTLRMPDIVRNYVNNMREERAMKLKAIADAKVRTAAKAARVTIA